MTEKTQEKVEEAKVEPKAEKKEEKIEEAKVEKKEEKAEEPKAEKKEEKAEEPKAEKKEEKVEEPKAEKKEEKVEEPKAEKKEEKAKEPKAEKKEEKAKESKAEEKEEAGPVLEGKMAEFVDWIEGISVLELSKLVKGLEDRLGVSAAAPVAMVAAPGAAAGGEAGGVEEKTEFDVILTACGDKKIQVIKEVRSLTSLGLKEAKDLVDSAPKPVQEGVTKDEAESMKAKLEAVGATVELK